jgi:hypothetical protein
VPPRRTVAPDRPPGGGAPPGTDRRPTSARLRCTSGRSGAARQVPGVKQLALSRRPLRGLYLSAGTRCGQLAGWLAQPRRARQRRNCLFFNRLIDCIAPATFTHTHPATVHLPPVPCARFEKESTSGALSQRGGSLRTVGRLACATPAGDATAQLLILQEVNGLHCACDLYTHPRNYPPPPCPLRRLRERTHFGQPATASAGGRGRPGTRRPPQPRRRAVPRAAKGLPGSRRQTGLVQQAARPSAISLRGADSRTRNRLPTSPRKGIILEREPSSH